MNQANPPLAERTAEQESPASAAHGATQSLGSPATHAAAATRADGNRPNSFALDVTDEQRMRRGSCSQSLTMTRRRPRWIQITGMF